ncbi:MAG: DUF2058 family protein [Wenzhouxiangellaceae bacterium]|nr:DUF2058 family protein [Wenzhouxiangellaceae bacterium]
MGSLQDALLQTGLAKDKPVREAREQHQARGTGKPSGPHDKRSPRAPNDAPNKKSNHKHKPGPKRESSDLERAWVARERAEQAERERKKQARLADQEARRQRNRKLDALIEGQPLNVDDAELPRYFEHLGRIRRVLCTPEQRAAINSGELGVVNLRGRYWIVEPAIVEQWRAIAPDLVPDLAGKEPDEPEDSGEYPPVPDDLTW